ncbi:MAG: hypothetical protein ACFE8A_04670 [Candidatus Hodarchaeota archaeon]
MDKNKKAINAKKLNITPALNSITNDTSLYKTEERNNSSNNNIYDLNYLDWILIKVG